MRHQRQRLVVFATAGVVVALLGTTVALISNHRAASTAAAVSTAPPATLASGPTTATTQAMAATTSTTSAQQVISARSTPATSLWRISDPAKAAGHLYDAWRGGDRQRALRFASSAAVDTMFAVPRDLAFTFSGCQYRQFGFDCAYTGDRTIAMRVEGGASAGYRVGAVSVRDTSSATS